jgi:hypothetical protein
MADGRSGIEINLSTNRKRYFKYCKHKDIHPDDAHKSGCTVYDPAGVMAGIRWVPCSEEASYADPNVRIANEEKWAMTVCRKHYLEAISLIRRTRLNELRASEKEKDVFDKIVSGWYSYPEKHTVTLPIGHTVTPPSGCETGSFIPEKKMSTLEDKTTGPFQAYALNEQAINKSVLIGNAFVLLWQTIVEVNRPDPNQVHPTLQDPAAQGWPPVNDEEMTQCLRKLQEASFYAKRAMSVLPENWK